MYIPINFEIVSIYTLDFLSQFALFSHHLPDEGEIDDNVTDIDQSSK
jgi:hypothetical protein